MFFDNDNGFEIPVRNPIVKIKVMGVGGGGCHAVNRMIKYNFKGPEFIAVNTDMQDLMMNPANYTLQIGAKLTRGMGAGANPEIGKLACEESYEAIKKTLEGTDLLFITAGMGGGTGTGAAPIIAQIAREMKILTIAVVTRPFSFEGMVRAKNAELGIQNLKKHVDTLVIIPNERLRFVMDKKTSIIECFRYADDVLRQAIQGISDLILTPGLINLDFADIKSIMEERGCAHMGIARAKGDNKMELAVKQAVESPLLDTKIEGATGILLNFKSGIDLSLEEVYIGANLVREAVDPNCNIIFGTSIDSSMENEVEVTIIATGFDESNNVKSENIFNNTKESSMFNSANKIYNAYANSENSMFDDFATQGEQKLKVSGGFVDIDEETNSKDVPPFLIKAKK